MRKLIFTFCTFFIIVSASFAQILNITPAFPTVNDTVTVIYDATEGNGALTGVTPVYAHAGVITTQSTSPSDWKFVQGNWGTADPNTLMTDLGNNKHQLKYHFSTYYGLPANTTVLEMAFVFRNAAGNTVGRAADGSDIYYPVYPANAGLLAAILQPSGQAFAKDIGETIDVYAAASDTVSLSLYDNGMLLTQTNARSLNYTLTVNTGGTHLVEFVADDGNTTIRDTFYYVGNSPLNYQNAPANTELGINYLTDSTLRLSLYAPNKKNVYVIGDFNNWLPDTNYYMNLSADSTTWWIDIDGLVPGQEYAFQYLVDGILKIADPHSEVVLDPNNDQWIPAVTYPNLHPYPSGKTSGIATLIKMARPAYQWQATNYEKPKQTELVIYELLMRDFIARHDYETLIDTLDYLENLGINAIELMPVNEFEGNESWGYNPSFHGALDKYYGTIEDFKAFIDECHSRNIAVIMDVVYNHAFSQSPLAQLYWDAANFRPSLDNPWLNEVPRHAYNVGYDFNHESQATKNWMDRVSTYWINEFKIDGFRYDLSKGFTQTMTDPNVGQWGQYDASRIALLKRMADVVWAADSTFYVILEHFANNTEEKELSDYGMMVWGNSVHDYNEATMGYPSNLSWGIYKARGFNDPHVVTYMESHDEERLMFKNLSFGNSNGNYNVRDLATGLRRVEAAAAFFFTIPGPKMFWQFAELGYDISIDDPCRVCPKPILWNYNMATDRKRLYDVFSSLMNLRKEHTVFNTTTFTWEVGAKLKRLKLEDADMKVVVLGNFDVAQGSINPSFYNTGQWYEFFSGDSMMVNDVTAPISLEAGEYRLYTSKRLDKPTITSTPFVNNKTFEATAFPNPAASQLHLVYTLPKSGKVQITAYNLLGQRVGVLANEWQDNGLQQIDWNVEKMEAGQYFIEIRMDNKVERLAVVVVD